MAAIGTFNSEKANSTKPLIIADRRPLQKLETKEFIPPFQKDKEVEEILKKRKG